MPMRRSVQRRKTHLQTEKMALQFGKIYRLPSLIQTKRYKLARRKSMAKPRRFQRTIEFQALQQCFRAYLSADPGESAFVLVRNFFKRPLSESTEKCNGVYADSLVFAFAVYHVNVVGT